MNKCCCVGFNADPGDSAFFFVLHMLLLELSPISFSCSALAFAQDRSPWGLSAKGLEKLCNRCGDVLEAVGGICDPRSSDAQILRTFLVTKYDITESDFVAIRNAQTSLLRPMFLASKFAQTEKALMDIIYEERQLVFMADNSLVGSDEVCAN